ncbi:MAG: DNA topoisomerase VI subunit B [Methanomicrobiales archaeon]|nr:DNA topoisomerase VI subunit B [Methanomicrobiales archaeon]
MALADELARQQRSISVAEFFERNKHLLGFDSPTRGVITTVKEAVDNALDACEEACILPDLFIAISRVRDDIFRITVEDNGPGIVPAQVPYVFGKLLYGSRFHQIRQSRGQQGIGISAAVLYAQLTTGTPTVVVSRTSPDTPAHRFQIQIAIMANEPEVVGHEEVPWDRTHGTRIEIQFRSSLTARKRLLEYLKYTSVVNPHARISLVIEDEPFLFERVSDEVIEPPKAIQPHPHGIELGQLKRMAASVPLPLDEFLVQGFSRVGKKTATDICERAGLSPSNPASGIIGDDLTRLLAAMQAVKVPAPPAGLCLSPIGEALIVQGLEKEFQMDFVRARTRPGSVSNGHPFMVEAAIGYGGRLNPEGNAVLIRFANRVPLMYQQGACAITQAVTSMNWRSYGISQQGLPIGPLLVLVHVASTSVPFTSESKDAIADIPEIAREVTLALQDLGRDLKTFLSRRDRTRLQDDRARAVCAILPEIATKVAEITERPVPDITPIEGRIMKYLILKRKRLGGKVLIEAANHMGQSGTFMIYLISADSAGDASTPPVLVTGSGGEYTVVWQVALEPGMRWETRFSGSGCGGLEIRGVDPGKVMVVDEGGEG